MLRRHIVLPSGLKVDRDWWRSTKLGIAVAVALLAAYSLDVNGRLPFTADGVWDAAFGQMAS